ncbi:hypothetical protein Bca4012_017377 [Brassica carinata]
MAMLALPFPRVCGESVDSNLSEGGVWLFDPEVFPRCSRKKWLIGGLAVGILFKYLSWSSESAVACSFEDLTGDFGFNCLHLSVLLCVCVA